MLHLPSPTLSSTAPPWLLTLLLFHLLFVGFSSVLRAGFGGFFQPRLRFLMAEAKGCTAIFSSGSQGELFDEQSPFFPLPEAAEASSHLPRESMVRKLLPTVYSGPTIGDIETALSMSGQGAAERAGARGSPPPAVAVPEKGFNKMENKYTLRIKCCGNGMADDGYKWRKYGQKSIKNSPNPRSYYRCTNPRCNAKKQVERSAEDPETLVVTYEGLHLHYAYSHFLLPWPRDFSTALAAPPAAKRTKLEVAAAAAPRPSTPESPVAAGPATATGLITAPQPPQRGGEAVLEEGGRQQELGEGVGCGGGTPRVPQAGGDYPRTPQGLLEDIVPLLVRKPSSDTSTILSSNPSFSSVPSSPPSSSSSTFTWPHSPTYFDLGVLSGTV